MLSRRYDLDKFISINTVSAGGGADTNRYGDESYVPTTITEYQGWIEQTGTSEEITDRDTRVTRWLCILPADAVVTASDTVEWDGRSFRVVGDPREVPGNRGIHHIELTLESVEG